MSDANDLAAAFLAEMFMAEQLARARLSRALPKGMQLSHFGVLNLLARLPGERTPAELARAFHVTRGAMTNTLTRLEAQGHIHIRPDWDDGRRKFVSISPAGRLARDEALAGIVPLIAALVAKLGDDQVRAALPVLRALRLALEDALAAGKGKSGKRVRAAKRAASPRTTPALTPRALAPLKGP